MKHRTLIALSLCLALPALAACTPIKASHGNILTDTKIAEVTVGTSTRNDVRRAFGMPTSVAPFDNTLWYYIGENTETKGVFKTEVKERRILRVKFDENGVLQEVANVDPNLNDDVAIVERKTPTAGKEYTILQQMVGNVGRFQGSKEKAARKQKENR